MQCLFCGKELALLKRLRGGGEFCSEAHRKEYQEQYEQLALARLLQAKPRTEPAAPLSTPLPKTPAPAFEQPPAQVPAPAKVATMEAPVSMTAKPAASQPAEESDPALAGFLSDPMIPAVTSVKQAGVRELDNSWEHVAAPPSLAILSSADSAASEPSAEAGVPPPAPRVALSLSLQALGHHTRIGERGTELREFTSPAPIMELHLRPEAGTEPAGADDVMEILMSPHPPQKAKPWLGVPRGFPAAPAELGDLARLNFATSGFAYSDASAPADGKTQVPSAASPQSTLQTEPPPEAFVAPAQPEAPPEPLAAEPAPPELVTKALPVTLHGLAALRGKLAHTFPSSMAAASDVQIPASAALPLRPAIVFGPAPAPARAPEAAPSPSRPTEVQPKPVQPEPARPKAEEPVKSSVVPAPKSVPAKRPVAPETPVQEKSAPKVSVSASAAPPVSPRVEPRVQPRKEAPAPTAREAAAQDDAMPSLRMEATESAWSKLSASLKIGVAAAVVLGVSGIAYLVTHGNATTTKEAPAVATAAPAVASGVAISGGWIDDWANAARTRRHISLLSGSAKLSDYRLEFQAQIETKAIGWIFRGLNPRNYYVTKLEVVTPGLEPTVALVHFAVVDGQDENRVVVPLPMKVRVDTTYKIRFEAIGNRFTTFVQNQKIDEWTDSRFGSGGVGFFSERDEHAAMQGAVNVVPLVPKN
jgi:hypothetical protein